MSSHQSGVVIERVGHRKSRTSENSGVAKLLKVELIKTGKEVLVFVPGDGTLNYVDVNDKVIVEGGTKKYGDSDAKYRLVKVAGVSLKKLDKI
jgi:small subunit ribosomal protein S23e